MADVAPPLLDFAPIGNLADIYRQARQQAQIDAARQSIAGQVASGQPLDFRSAGALIGAGDPQGMTLANLAQHQYLTSPEYLAKAERAKLEVQKEFTPNTVDVKTPGPFGDTVSQTVEKVGPGQYRPITLQSGSGGTTPGQSGILAKGVSSLNPELKAKDYLDQFSPEFQAAVQSYLDGRSNPASNPRKGWAEAVKAVGQKFGADIGIPADDASIAQRRTLLNDLSKTNPGSAGGQITFARTSLNHLANVAEAAAGLNNVDTGFTPINSLINNARALSSTQAAKIAALQDAAQHYGQEVTKFYAGSPGGEGERTRFLTALAGAKSPQELAAVIEAEKNLIPERLGEIKNRMENILGPSAANFPVESPESVSSVNKINKTLARMRGQPEPTDLPAPATPQRPELIKSDQNAWRTKETVTAARSNPQAAIAEARAAIAAGAPRNVVIQRLQQVGIDPSGL